MTMDEQEIRRELAHLLEELELSPPLDPHDLCSRLGDHLGQPILLVGETIPAPSATGVLVPFPDKWLIVYQQATTPSHQAHIIFHELVHIIRGHLLDAGGVRCTVSASQSDDPAQHAREQEAEIGATILTAWSNGSFATPALRDSDPAVNRLTVALGGSTWT